MTTRYQGTHAAVVLFTVLWTTCGSAQTPPRNDPKNVITGDCDTFNTTVKNRGALDEYGKGEPNRTGYTRGLATADPRGKAGKAVPTPEGQGYRVCLSAITVQPGFRYWFKKDILTWAPNGGISALCKKEKERFTQSVLTHENKHEEIYRHYADEAISSWTQREFNPTICGTGSSPLAARTAANRAMDRSVNAFVTRQLFAIFHEADLTSIVLDQDPNELIETIDCSKCKGKYRATGQGGDWVYSGVICSLEKPFTVTTSAAGFLSFPTEFIPRFETGGTWSFSWAKNVMLVEGGGFYTVEEADADNLRIAMTGSAVGRIPGVYTGTAGGDGHIDLVPLDTDECNK